MPEVTCSGPTNSRITNGSRLNADVPMVDIPTKASTTPASICYGVSKYTRPLAVKCIESMFTWYCMVAQTKFLSNKMSKAAKTGNKMSAVKHTLKRLMLNA